MSYSQQFLCADNASSADWWSWGGGISSFLSANGWTKTSDYNVTWGTTAVPAAGAYVYEVWESNDSLSSGPGAFPYYMKVEYGNAVSNNCPMLRISFSTGPSTSGTLSGNVIGPFYLQAGNTAAETTGATFECDMSTDGTSSVGAGQRLGLLMWRTAANANRPCFLAVERAISWNGSTFSYNSNYLTVVSGGYNSAVAIQQQTLWNPTLGVSTTLQTNWASLPSNLSTNLALNNVPFLPVFPMVGYVDNFLTAVGTTKANDMVEGTTNTATLYGTSHPFLASYKANWNSGILSVNNGLLMRID